MSRAEIDEALHACTTLYVLNAPQVHHPHSPPAPPHPHPPVPAPATRPADLCDPIRFGFHLEEAHWHYLDVCRVRNPRLPDYSLALFYAEARPWRADAVLAKLPFLLKQAAFQGKSMAQLCEEFTSYKATIPVAGAIIIDNTFSHMLLVKAKNAVRWFFPKGKANKNESTSDCARREVLEEVGFDIRTADVSSTVFEPGELEDQRMTLFGVT
eukprot:gene3736-4145_t